VNDSHGLGILLAYFLKETPFLAVMVLSVLLRAGPDYDALARSLGATHWQRVRYVTLPLVAPALLAGSLIVFAFLFGAFEVPLLLGRTYPPLLGVLAQRRFASIELIDRPDAFAIAFLMAALTGVLVWLFLRVSRAWVGDDRPAVF